MTKSDPNSELPSKRIPELDGLRGIAILLILAIHYLGNNLHPAKGTAVAYFCSAISLTWSGVDLFFVLSGFLIAGILLEQREATNYFRIFYLRRIYRIFPLYFMLLSGYFVARTLLSDQSRFAPIFGDSLPIWRYATFTQNIRFTNWGFEGHWLPVTWSLAVEEQFYLILPCLIRFLPLRLLPSIFVGLSIMAVALRVHGPHFVAYINMPWRADSLLVGALLAYGARSRDFMTALMLNKRWLWMTFGIMLCGTIVLSSSAMSNWAERGGALVHSWLALFYTTLLALALVDRAGWLGRFLRARVLVWLGTISYGVYLLHPLVFDFTHILAGNTSLAIHDARDFSLTVAAFAITLLLAALSFFGMERPILRGGHCFRYKRWPQNDGSETGPAATVSPS